jgi:hypothetical protein
MGTFSLRCDAKAAVKSRREAYFAPGRTHGNATAAPPQRLAGYPACAGRPNFFRVVTVHYPEHHSRGSQGVRHALPNGQAGALPRRPSHPEENNRMKFVSAYGCAAISCSSKVTP